VRTREVLRRLEIIFDRKIYMSDTDLFLVTILCSSILSVIICWIRCEVTPSIREDE